MVNLAERVLSLQNAIDMDLGKHPDFHTSDMSQDEALKASFQTAVFKKLEPLDCKDKSRAKKAVALWLSMNDRCKDSFKEPTGEDYLDDILFTYREFLRHSLDTTYGPLLNYADVLANGKHGPGASTATKARSHFEKLFMSERTCTDVGLDTIYRYYLPKNWKVAELIREAKFPKVVIASNRLFTVSKNSEIDRCATTVPSLNMFYQLGAGELLKIPLARDHGINLSKQPRTNQTMAKIGSACGRYGTTDLKSASDSISVAFAKWSLDKRSFDFLERINSRVTVIPKNISPTGKDVIIEQDIFCTMGNGFTFPLQTLMFASVVKACYWHLQIPIRAKDGSNLYEYSVFGDDIVVRREAFDIVNKVLERCGFIVNQDKSYNAGPFRESCGKDFFRGYNVRGVYIRKLTNAASIYSAFNRIASWSVRHNISMWRSLAFLRSLVVFRPVPFDASDEGGFKWPSSSLSASTRNGDGTHSYRELTKIPYRRRIAVTAITVPGLYLSLLKGYINSDVIPSTRKKRKKREKQADAHGIRVEGLHKGRSTEDSQETFVMLAQRRDDGEGRYQVVRKVTPSWDYLSDPGLTIRGYESLVAVLNAV